MKLAGKFALIVSCVAALTSSVFAVDHNIRSITVAGTTATINADVAGGAGVPSVPITFGTSAEATAFLKNLSQPGTLSVTFATTTAVPTHTYKLILPTGVQVTLTIPAVGTLSLPITRTDAPAGFLAVGKTSTVADKTKFTIPAADATQLDLLLADAPEGMFAKLAFPLADDATEIKAAIDGTGIYSRSFSALNARLFLKASNAVSAAPPTVQTHQCYKLADGRLFCAKFEPAAAGGGPNTLMVTIVYKGPSTNSEMVTERIVPAALTLLVAFVSSVGMSHVHALVDPEGYQAGKDASSLPPGLKYFYADTGISGEGYENLTDDDGFPVTIDPKTNLPNRVRKTGEKILTDDETEQAEGETTDAFGVSVMAAFLLVPFLL